MKAGKIKIGDVVKCKAGNMRLTAIGVVWKVKPAFAHYPEELFIDGILNYADQKWSGQIWADDPSIIRVGKG